MARWICLEHEVHARISQCLAQPLLLRVIESGVFDRAGDIDTRLMFGARRCGLSGRSVARPPG